MIDETREDFFARHNATPCQYCLKRNYPGIGIGPILADLMFESYAIAEEERLQRLARLDAKSDDYDKTLKARNHEIYIRACWLGNVTPDDAVSSSNDPADDASSSQPDRSTSPA